ncbi:10884_t:CDS:2, partial [Entrophospora sp. SA101]
ICPKRLALPELKNELTNRGIVYDNQNKRQKLIEMLDKELSQETLANVEVLGLPLRNRSMVHQEQEISPLESSEFPLVGGWALKEVQKYGKKGGGKQMLDVLKSKVEEGEIENSDLPKLPTIQGWITRYSAQLCEKNAKTTLGVSN